MFHDFHAILKRELNLCYVAVVIVECLKIVKMYVSDIFSKQCNILFPTYRKHGTVVNVVRRKTDIHNCARRLPCLDTGFQVFFVRTKLPQSILYYTLHGLYYLFIQDIVDT